MTRSRLSLKAPGLCILVLGLIAFMGASAKAEVGANWKVNGVNVNSTLKPKLSVVLENETISLLFTVVGIPSKILCRAVSTTNTLGANGSINEGKTTFSSCGTFLKGSATASIPCLPKTAGVNDVIESNGLVGLLVLVSGKGEMLMKAAAEGKPLAVIESTEECAIGQKLNVTGEFMMEDCANQMSTELVTHLMENDNLASLLRVAGQPATIDGSANVSLAGAHSGLKWSGVPA